MTRNKPAGPGTGEKVLQAMETKFEMKALEKCLGDVYTSLSLVHTMQKEVNDESE